jgi:NADH-quinone oxidoreductase subunit G
VPDPLIETVTITIDGKQIKTAQGKSVIEAALESGIMIPHYCYHPSLTVAGNCRMCLVEITKVPKLQIACNTKTTEGMEVQTQNAKVVAARQAVMEFLLINHPLDCPICDQAGECRLQEYYMQHDLMDSRFRERKERERKREVFGPYVLFDGERCIKCTRCVRFCQEITQTEEITVVNRSDQTTIALFPGMVLDNPLSANVIDLCPVGALTDRDFRFRKRVWELNTTPSICPGCSTGCNITIGASQNRIYRFKPRINEEVNGHWICDEGRYSFHALTEGERITQPYLRRGNGLVEAAWEEALAETLRGLRESQAAAAILSGRSTNEEAFLFVKLAEGFLGMRWAEVVYEERPLTRVEKILKSPDRSPNYLGARHMGLGTNNGEGNGYAALLEAIKAGAIQALYVVGEDLVGAHSDLKESLCRIPFLVVQDSRWTETSRLAHVVLAGTHFAEKEGTATSRRMRLQRLRPALIPPPQARQDWRIFRDLLLAGGVELRLDSPDDVFSQIGLDIPSYRGLTTSGIGELGVPLPAH